MVNQYFRRMVRVGTQMRTAATLAIFEKGLRLSAASRARYTTGEITNLMSIDAQRFLDVMTYINVVWACPVQFSLAIYFLYDLVGVAAISGLSVFLVVIQCRSSGTNRDWALGSRRDHVVVLLIVVGRSPLTRLLVVP